MKNTIKEICKREGRKVEVSVGNVREVMARFTEILAENNQVVGNEFVKYLADKITSKTGKICSVTLHIQLHEEMCPPSQPKPKKKVTKKARK